MKHMHWIVIADAAGARVFAADTLLRSLEPIAELDHREGRQPVRDLVSDDRGRSDSPAGPRSGMEGRSDPRQVEAESFAREVADLLRSGVDDDAYERLIVVAAPRFLGLLRQVMDDRVRERAVGEVAKDLTHISEHEVLDRVRRALPATAGMPPA